MTNNSEAPVRLVLPDGRSYAAEIGGAAWAHWAVITITTEHPNVKLTLRGSNKHLAQKLQELADIAKGRTVAEVDLAIARRRSDMTPADVVAYFEQSPVLQSMADDVREVLLGKGSSFAPSQFQSDLDAVKSAMLVNPTKADIAELLTGQRTYGGAMFARINRIMKALETTSTTASERATQLKAA